jgi:glyoxylase-like metal-dependent hydrolase (beta-lactamase superfamily II)
MSVSYEDNLKRIHKIEASPYANNCYIIVCKETNASAIIDTPIDYQKIIAESESTNVKHILITHNHFDHLEGYLEIKKRFPLASVGIGNGDVNKLPEKSSAINLFIQDGYLEIGNLLLNVIVTPGHTPGSTCYLIDNHLFSGDTLFPGGPGRTGSPEDFHEIISSITNKLFKLESKIIVQPGHGDDTNIGTAKEEYEVFAKETINTDLHGDVTWIKNN